MQGQVTDAHRNALENQQLLLQGLVGQLNLVSFFKSILKVAYKSNQLVSELDHFCVLVEVIFEIEFDFLVESLCSDEGTLRKPRHEELLGNTVSGRTGLEKRVKSKVETYCEAHDILVGKFALLSRRSSTKSTIVGLNLLHSERFFLHIY